MNIRTTGKSTVIALIFAVSAGTSTLLNAKLQDVEIKSLTLSFADLNLRDAADQQTLQERLQRAAKEVCETRKARTAEQIRNSRECYENALDDALAEIGNSGLVALHAN